MDPEQFMQQLFGITSIPQYTDPKKYPTRVQIKHDASLLKIAQVLEFEKRMNQLAKEFNLAQQRYTLAHDELFNMLGKAYPSIQYDSELKVQVGLRKFEDDWYYVGWKK